VSKYIAQHLGVRDVVVSPTFTICREYNGQVDDRPLKFYHLDTYRLQDPQEIESLRPQQIFQSPHIVVIEWANNVHEHIQQYIVDAVVIQVNITSPHQHTRQFQYTIQS
jgi:tRNA threonylcarbamoyladenosine biosynthesis protein TsaE